MSAGASVGLGGFALTAEVLNALLGLNSGRPLVLALMFDFDLEDCLLAFATAHSQKAQ